LLLQQSIVTKAQEQSTASDEELVVSFSSLLFCSHSANMLQIDWGEGLTVSEQQGDDNQINEIDFGDIDFNTISLEGITTEDVSNEDHTVSSTSSEGHMILPSSHDPSLYMIRV